MEVLIDGKQIISTEGQFFKDGFTGIRLVNGKGNFNWNPFKAMVYRVSWGI